MNKTQDSCRFSQAMTRKYTEGVLIHRIHKLVQVGILLIFFGNCGDMGDKILVEEIKGCTNFEACNFNPESTLDDGTCAFEEDICGICGGAGVVADDCCDEGETTDDCGVCGGDNSSCINFADEILPIFIDNCIGCHGGSGGLFLNTYENVIAGGGSGAVIEPGNHSNSYLWQRVDNGSMPPGSNPDLLTEQVNLIKQWINEGAQDN